jgi:hypothetical protein
LPFSISAQVEVSVAQPTSGSAGLILFFVPWSFFLLSASGVRRWLALIRSAWKTHDFHCLLVYLFPAQKFCFLTKLSVREPSWFSLPACLSFSRTEILFPDQALGPWAKLIFPMPWFFFAGCCAQHQYVACDKVFFPFCYCSWSDGLLRL